jgi:hypothetical protein
LYINGSDLLEGRYNIATRGIPADAVEKIDVMQKHNHNRIDIGRTESDKVAFNLKIKKDAGLIFGSMKADAGLPFLTGQLDATPIYIKNQFQNINSFKLNNNGKTLRDIGNDLTTGNVNFANLQLEKIPVLKEPNINGVGLSSKYWLDNDSYTITDDGLHKISETNLIKWNINYNNELGGIESKSTTEFLTNNATSAIVNQTRNQLRTQNFNAGVTQEINKRNLYLRNSTNFSGFKNAGIENIILNNNKIVSLFNKNEIHFNNATNFKTLLGNDRIIQGGIIAELEQKSENLNVVPPVFQNLTENNSNKDATIQDVYVKRLNIGGFSDYAFKIMKSDWNLRQNISYNDFNFESSLNQVPELQQQNFPFSSNFDFNKIATSTNLNCKFIFGKIKIYGSLSADFVSINTKENNDLSLTLNDSFFFMQPNLTAIYTINSKLILGTSYANNNTISNFSELYTPILLTTYNTVAQNPLFINTIKTQTFAPFLTYSNILKSFFLSVNGNLNNAISGVTFSSQLNDEGFMITEIIKQPNTLKNYSLSTSIKKGFLGSFNSTLTYSYFASLNDLFFNNQFITAINRRQSLSLKLIWDSGKWFSVEYDCRLNFGSSKFEDNQIKNSLLFQTASIDFYTTKSSRLNFGIESSRTTVSTNNNIAENTLFSTSYFYKVSKKINLNASLLNIFDTPFFTTTNSMSNFVNSNQFSLRTRQFTLGFTYSL